MLQFKLDLRMLLHFRLLSRYGLLCVYKCASTYD